MLFGTREKVLKSKNVDISKCVECECTEQIVTPSVRYTHSFMMPLFINEKKSVVVCTNCHTVTDTKEVEDGNKLHELAFEGEVLWGYYSGVFVLGFILILIMMFL